MKKKFIILGALVIVFLLIGGLYYFNLLDNIEANNDISADALKFKEEYESLNGTIRESDGALYSDIYLSEDNPIKYVDAKEALDILKNETAVIYMGAGWCPWCRNAVPVLLEAAEDYKVKTIYYLNLDDEKDVYEVIDGKLTKTTEGTEAYYELLEFLDDELDDYVITSEGKDYTAPEKRIYIPFVAVSKGGEVVDSITGTVTLDEGQTKYDPLTEEQHDNLLEDYKNLLEKIYARGICKDEC